MRHKEYKCAAVAAHACGSPDSVHKRIRILRWVELHNPINVWQVKTTSGNVGAKQHAAIHLGKGT
jgi:hypothetical protein